MFAFVRRVVSEVRAGLSTLRRVGFRIFLGLTVLQAVIVGVLVALAELRKRRQVPREGFPWEDQPEIKLEAGEDRLKIYAYGVNLYEAMLEEIEAAEGDIFVGTFIWKGDEVGRRFVEALSRKAGESSTGLPTCSCRHLSRGFPRRSTACISVRCRGRRRY
jgi:cardiolipin synthase